MGTGANVSNLAFIAGHLLTEGVVAAVGISEHDVSIAANIAGNQAGVKLAAGDQASFRISWIGSSNANSRTKWTISPSQEYSQLSQSLAPTPYLLAYSPALT